MDDATLRQVQAADPHASTWLSANAGSGKTKVLTDRVARLLMAGVQPQNILCLTYTKAAASEMQNRLFQRLGAWAMTPVEDLRQDLAKLGIEDLGSTETLADARRLFARAIETPGGLRIQTIHSYCAALLRRFPLEAGVSPNFVEMDDQTAGLLKDQVVEALAEHQPDVLDDLAQYLSGDDLNPVLEGILQHREAFARVVPEPEIKAWFGVAPGDDLAGLMAAVFCDDEAVFMPRVIGALLQSSTNDVKAADKLARVDWSAPSPDDLRDVFDVMLFGPKTKAPYGAKIGSLPTKAGQKLVGMDLDRLNDLMRRVEAAREPFNSLYAAQKTAALHRFAHAFLPAYEAEKTRRGWLDFDDLILRTRALLTNPDVAQWVLYRLDGGLDHILVDEAQDTSPVQWQVIERLAQELTAGQGAREGTERTIFVVGDKKQSIYSFQGADAEKFDEMREEFRERLRGSATPLNPLELEYSFRSSMAILGFVDETVAIDPIQHRAFFDGLPGRVDLWPVVPKPEKPDKKDWFDPVDIVGQNHEDVTLAREIAAFMQRSIGVETVPDGKGGRRLVRAADFLILVRRRSTLFAAIIRECKTLGLPVAGADRLKLGAELAVKDLAAVLAFLATPEDDLSLAAALRSPLFGWTEAELYDLAQGRGNVYLWRELSNRRDEFAETLVILDDLRSQADFLRPYDIIERILIRHDGRRRLLARLGAEAQDGIDALLSQALGYERVEVPSLTGFLTWMQTDDVEVKRQMDRVGDQIRVMTVHGAKGLESPIVILPDTAKRKPRNTDQVIALQGGAAWRVNAEEQPSAMIDALQNAADAQAREDERLFYVAATRAETWLIIAAAGDVKDDDGSWYAKAKTGIEALSPLELITPLGRGLRHTHGAWDHGALTQPRPTSAPEADLPEWVKERAAPPIRPASTLSPSDLGGAKALAGAAGQDEDAALRFGTMVHRLLDLGPGALDSGYAQRVMAAEFPNDDPQPAFDTAQRVLAATHLSHLFQSDVLSEVAITADVPGLGRLSGVIDKLVVGSDRIQAVDFKTNAVEPTTEADVPEGLLRQMGAYHAMLAAIYPDRATDVAILWTGSARLMPLSHETVMQMLHRTSTS